MANILTRLLGPSQKDLAEMANSYMQQWLNNRGPVFTPVMPIYPKVGQKEAVQKGYCDNTDIFSIVSRKARMAAGIPFYVYKVKKEGKKAFREYKALMSGEKMTMESLAMANVLKIKAMEEVEDTNGISQLLQRPNKDQSQTEFLEQVYGFLEITGNSYIWKEKLSMGANEGKPISMHSVASQYMTVVPDGTFPVSVLGYMYFLWGEMGLQKSEIIHMKYPNYDYQPDGSHLMGLSPLQAGHKTMARSDSEEDSATAQFQHGGPAGMFYNESMAPTEQNMSLVGGLKKKWEAETWGNKNRGKILFSPGKVGYVQAGLSPVDLQILESGKWTFHRLCNLWHMPAAIFNETEHATMSNMEQFYKAAYTDGVIPLVIKLRDALNASLLPDFGDPGEYFIDADFSNIPVLQQDMKTLTEWMTNSWWITPNEKREAQKFGRLPDPNMDKVWMPTGLDMMDNMSATPDQIDQDVIDLAKSGLNPYK
ncbi:phage portal protein [Chitinophaga pinensis]|uniref:Portal protein n=1 Tax=Chitinophaga pinensis (strain ATCC 43595 / DSM 2588 / LMG 13176 / NBRC 15968 / NCIMB 11800 / UQM 2034) TaxID=485918 RepID=A0A979GQD6_CHIPD|nr:phage portal protein [Chitinophaga pinensis]ACU61342.1 portal protein [Chitinophaga pinensis DSM 2588]